MTQEQITQLREELRPFNYVVMRNWQRLPQAIGMPGHEDLDLFVSDEDRGAVQDIIRNYPLVDLRSPADMYYPEGISDAMLFKPRIYNGFKIPAPSSYFDSLFYHAIVHKGSFSMYEKELKQAFLYIYPPVECLDKGVGYHVDR